jgi:hypothetical protein
MLGTARLLGQTTGAALVALFLVRDPADGTQVALLACRDARPTTKGRRIRRPFVVIRSAVIRSAVMRSNVSIKP